MKGDSASQWGGKGRVRRGSGGRTQKARALSCGEGGEEEGEEEKMEEEDRDRCGRARAGTAPHGMGKEEGHRKRENDGMRKGNEKKKKKRHRSRVGDTAMKEEGSMKQP